MIASNEFDPAILATDRATVLARIAKDDAIRQAVAPRPQAGIRGGQRRSWMPAPVVIHLDKPKRLGQFTLYSDSTTVTFSVSVNGVKVTTKPGHGAFNWLIKRYTTTLKKARAKYAELLRAGYDVW